ncbi:hypothetical protein KI387_018151, partial [Taxus chinensis]
VEANLDWEVNSILYEQHPIANKSSKCTRFPVEVTRNILPKNVPESLCGCVTFRLILQSVEQIAIFTCHLVSADNHYG